MNFTMLDNQHGLLTLTAVDGAGNPAAYPTDTTATSSDTTVGTVSPASGLAQTFLVTGVSAGSFNVVVASTSAGVSTTFGFTLSGSAVAGFTATFTGVTNN
jgi:hypothetical protein